MKTLVEWLSLVAVVVLGLLMVLGTANTQLMTKFVDVSVRVDQSHLNSLRALNVQLQETLERVEKLESNQKQYLTGLIILAGEVAKLKRLAGQHMQAPVPQGGILPPGLQFRKGSIPLPRDLM